MKFNKIFLIGPMGSGKSTIGKILSDKINYKFYDSDEEITKKLNNNINNIFNLYGLLYFRNIEKKIIKEISNNKNNIILSVGGGSIESIENRIIFKKGFTIFLNANLFSQIKRINNNYNRPLLTNNKNNNYHILYNIYNKRINYYINTSDIIINTDNTNILSIVNNITNIINKIKNKI